MDNWKEIKFDGISKIDKCVAEFNIWEQNKTPWAKFKIKVFEAQDGTYTGFSNLLIIDTQGDYYCSVGYGDTIDAALYDTIKYFQNSLKWKDDWTESDFQCTDPYDF